MKKAVSDYIKKSPLPKQDKEDDSDEERGTSKSPEKVENIEEVRERERLTQAILAQSKEDQAAMNVSKSINERTTRSQRRPRSF